MLTSWEQFYHPLAWVEEGPCLLDGKRGRSGGGGVGGGVGEG